MLLTSRLSVVLGLLAASPALPDVVNVGVNGSISGSGGVGYLIGLFPPPGLSFGDTESSSFTFGGTNAQLGTFTRSGATGFTEPTFGITDALSVQAQQHVTATATSIQLGITNIETPSGNFAASAERLSFWSAHVSNEIAVTFTISSESVVALNGAFENGFSATLLDSGGNTVFTFPISGPFTTTQLTLAAGTYQFQDTFDGGIGGQGFQNNGPQGQADRISAIFSPVPEPRWAGFLVVLLLAGGCWWPRVSKLRG